VALISDFWASAASQHAGCSRSCRTMHTGPVHRMHSMPVYLPATQRLLGEIYTVIGTGKYLHLYCDRLNFIRIALQRNAKCFCHWLQAVRLDVNNLICLTFIFCLRSFRMKTKKMKKKWNICSYWWQYPTFACKHQRYAVLTSSIHKKPRLIIK